MNLTGKAVTAAIVASGVFGGMIGALATDATQSQANPAAIAAAVQRVQDTTADNALRSIRTELVQINTGLAPLANVSAELAPLTDIDSKITDVDTTIGALNQWVNNNLGPSSGGSLYEVLYRTCVNAEGPNVGFGC